MRQNRYSKLGYRVAELLRRSDIPLVRTVQTDSMTAMADECFDMPFDGECKFYPFEMPTCITRFKTLVITGRSGSGKSTLLKHFAKQTEQRQYYGNEYIPVAFIRSGIWPEDFQERIESVGLDLDRIVVKKYNYLSEGEKFRADVALKLSNDAVFDEFTSMVDRMVAKTVCLGISKYISEHNLSGIVMCSCHKDFIEWMQPDYIIDLDDSAVYSNCSGCTDADCTEDNLRPIGNFKI